MSAILKEGVPGFRLMEATDLPDVLQIEKAVYEFPWSEGILRDCLRVGYECVVQEIDEKIAAYAVMTVAARESHLLNLCVRPEMQGRSFGRSMLEHMLDRARRLNADNLFLEVRESNTAAITLYHSSGFNEIGIRRNYYPAKTGREDAIIFALTFQDAI